MAIALLKEAFFPSFVSGPRPPELCQRLPRFIQEACIEEAGACTCFLRRIGFEKGSGQARAWPLACGAHECLQLPWTDAKRLPKGTGTWQCIPTSAASDSAPCCRRTTRCRQQPATKFAVVSLFAAAANGPVVVVEAADSTADG